MQMHDQCRLLYNDGVILIGKKEIGGVQDGVELGRNMMGLVGLSWRTDFLTGGELKPLHINMKDGVRVNTGDRAGQTTELVDVGGNSQLALLQSVKGSTSSSDSVGRGVVSDFLKADQVSLSVSRPEERHQARASLRRLATV